MLFLAFQLAPPTHTSQVMLNGALHCYNYYYASPEGLAAFSSHQMAIANHSCTTTLFLSFEQLSSVQLTIQLIDAFSNYSLAGQVSTALIDDVSLEVIARDINDQYFDFFQFALAVSGQILTVQQSSIRMSGAGELRVAGSAGIVAAMLKNTTLVDFGNLEFLFTNVKAGFSRNLTLSFQMSNPDQIGYLNAFKLACNDTQGVFMCSSCAAGSKFDSNSASCASEVVDGMNCDRCALGFIRGRKTQTKDESNGCYERAGTDNPRQYDCYYTQTAGRLQKSCLTKQDTE